MTSHIHNIYLLNNDVTFSNLDLRLKAQAASSGIKILKNEIESNAKSTIESFLYQDRADIRNIRLFYDTRGTLPLKSPVSMIINGMSHYHMIICKLQWNYDNH